MKNLTLINATFVNNSKPMMVAWSTYETAHIVGIEMVRSKRGIVYPAFIVERFGYLEAIHMFDTLRSSCRDGLIAAYNSCNGSLEEFYQLLKNEGLIKIQCIGMKMNEHMGAEFPEFVLTK